MSLTKSQSARLVREGVLNEVFCHASLGRFDVGALHQLTARSTTLGAKPLWCRFDAVRAETGDPDPMAFLTAQREIDADRVAELTGEDLDDQVIFVACPAGINGGEETHLLVDGIHRITARHQRGYQDFVFWLVPWSIACYLRPLSSRAISVPWGHKEVRDGQLVDRGT